MSEEHKGLGVAMKLLIVVGLGVVVGTTIMAKNSSKEDSRAEADTLNLASSTTSQDSNESWNGNTAATTGNQGLPKLLDLGAGKCVPCKMMAPILEELKEEYAGKFEVVFIDVWENQSAGAQYGIRVIPTQIFFDSEGKELFRHEGFYSKEDILGKWKQLGITFSDSSEPENSNPQ